MEIGVIFPQTELAGDAQAARAFAQGVEALGFHHLLAYDHVVGATHAHREPPLTGPYTERDPFHDPLALFAHLAAVTERLELVTGVLVLPQRQTVLVARQAADVDLFSGGRLRLGVGLGWNWVEYQALGESFRDRGHRIEEQIELLRRLWREPLVTFAGRWHRLDRVALNPRPGRDIPIWMGGFAERAHERAVRLADGFLCADGAADAFAQLGRLKALVEEAGRPAAGFGVQCNLLRAKTPQAVVDTALRWREAGGSHVAVSSLGLGLHGAAAHLAHLERVARALADAGLLATA